MIQTKISKISRHNSPHFYNPKTSARRILEHHYKRNKSRSPFLLILLQRKVNKLNFNKMLDLQVPCRCIKGKFQRWFQRAVVPFLTLSLSINVFHFSAYATLNYLFMCVVLCCVVLTISLRERLCWGRNVRQLTIFHVYHKSF